MSGGPGVDGKRTSPLLVAAGLLVVVLVIGGVAILLVRGFIAAGPEPDEPYEPPDDAIEFSVQGANGQDLDDLAAAAVERVVSYRLDRADVAFSSIESADGLYYLLLEEGFAPSTADEAVTVLSGPVTFEFRAVLALNSGEQDLQVAEPDSVGADDRRTLEQLDCEVFAGTPTPASGDGLIACAAEDPLGYLLGPAHLDGLNVDTVSVDETNHELEIGFDSDGAEALHELTTQLHAQSTPGNQMAMVAENEVVSAPAVLNPIPGGRASLAGFSAEQTELVAAQLTLAMRGGQVVVLGTAGDS